MFVLDTNHLREFTSGSAIGSKLRQRMNEASADVVTSVITAEEALRGWMAKLASAKSPEQEVSAYRHLDRLIGTLALFVRLPWDVEASARFQSFRKSSVRISTPDLRIACICIEHDATLLTRNRLDFAKVPGLKSENWLD